MARHETPSPRPASLTVPAPITRELDRVELHRVRRERLERTRAATRVATEIVEQTERRAKAFRPPAPLPPGASDLLQLLTVYRLSAHVRLLSATIALHPDADELRSTQAWALAIEAVAAIETAVGR